MARFVRLKGLYVVEVIVSADAGYPQTNKMEDWNATKKSAGQKVGLYPCETL